MLLSISGRVSTLMPVYLDFICLHHHLWSSIHKNFRGATTKQWHQFKCQFPTRWCPGSLTAGSMVDIMIYRTCSWARYKQSKKVFTKSNSTNIYISLSLCYINPNVLGPLPVETTGNFFPTCFSSTASGRSLCACRWLGFLMGRSCENHGKKTSENPHTKYGGL